MRFHYTKALLTLLIPLSSLGHAAWAQIQVVQSNFFGEVVPQYMCSETANRLAVVYKARLTGLTANATYRFFTRGLLSTDLGMSTAATGAGAGNPLFVSSSSTIYTTAPILADPTNSGSFSTDANGSYSGWFAFVNTGNVRFTAGNSILPGVVLNDGGSGTVPAIEYVLDQTISVLKLASTADANSGTGIWGSSMATAKNVVALYDNASGSGRPISTAYVEDLGVTIASQPTFYSTNVHGQVGKWGALIPNLLPTGVLNITQYDASGSIIGNNTSTNGTWGSANTVSPTGGTTAIEITNAVAPLDVVTAAKPTLAQTLSAIYHSDRQSLELTSKEAGSYRICSLTGQTVARVNLARGVQAQLGTQGWTRGIYMIVDERAGRTLRTVIQ